MKLDPKEYAKRRQQLMDMMSPNSIAIIPSAPPTIRNRDVEHPFRQDSDFYYLSGFAEEHAVVVLLPGREHGEYVLFCQEKLKEQEIWTGRRVGPEAAPQVLGCDDAFPISDIDDILPGLIEGKDRVYASLGVSPNFDNQLMQWVNHIKMQVRNGATPPREFSALDHLLHEIRLIKSAAEIKVMQRAADISADAHTRVMSMVKPGMYEYELEAELMRTFMAAGSRWPAYPSIVGTGDNACILHYTQNTEEIKDGDLILIDAGCELDYYASDITRTFPANGKFSEPQRKLYQLVLDANYAAIAAVKPGVDWNTPHEVAVKVLVEGLVEYGLLQGEVSELIESLAYKPFYMHKTGHWLGMDVHDVGEYRIDGEWRILEEGMVMTIEPGLYIAPDDLTVDEQWRGIGIRIEDDVVVTKDGCKVLTTGVVKDVADVEALIQG
ncbi:MAG: Xaa-Pro aminopeptidase [Oceanospirillaceae bacterium]|uniref:Xaa-Pro aminopeptidase n=1 Tax=unclassified Thalassolituus TaxID=2624967 RepID=UPI000C4D80CE|nr:MULTISPECIES: Xaa-Pro aminopeptidase [unclassified Thalassolituus]MAS25483.1 Xaa-Pro aminopeptidase [Oceanospirillaceae bacterium]MBS53785.1 Xaa-Pro aminopeptidase [Oceanospirillaceae bacterium]|tara:strand:+ start:2496 stop:3809 length:1314 start_codon:yes stop_codon:yes gene_type:complete